MMHESYHLQNDSFYFFSQKIPPPTIILMITFYMYLVKYCKKRFETVIKWFYENYLVLNQGRVTSCALGETMKEKRLLLKTK